MHFNRFHKCCNELCLKRKTPSKKANEHLNWIQESLWLTKWLSGCVYWSIQPWLKWGVKSMSADLFLVWQPAWYNRMQCADFWQSISYSRKRKCWKIVINWWSIIEKKTCLIKGAFIRSKIQKKITVPYRYYTSYCILRRKGKFPFQWYWSLFFNRTV